MNSIDEIDFLIVGHGLAGALLADALEGRGVEPIVTASSLPHAATPVAAGILNPLIGPRLNPPWRIEDCLKTARQTYRKMEKKWSVSFFRELRMLRIFKDDEMARRWEQQRENDKISSFMGRTLTKDEMQKFGIHSPLGAGEVLSGGVLDIQELIQASREHLKNEGRFLTNSFCHENLPTNTHIIFCEGFRVVKNPWFSRLPFAPVRGEILELDDMRSELLNGGAWFVPQDHGKALAGSTFDWDNLEGGPTEKGAQTILNGLDYLAEQKPNITGQRSGVRPATRDRMPIIGTHPKNPFLHLFNGFGSRGGTLIPLCADLLLDHLLGGESLPMELNLLTL